MVGAQKKICENPIRLDILRIKKKWNLMNSRQNDKKVGYKLYQFEKFNGLLHMIFQKITLKNPHLVRRKKK